MNLKIDKMNWKLNILKIAVSVIVISVSIACKAPVVIATENQQSEIITIRERQIQTPQVKIDTTAIISYDLPFIVENDTIRIAVTATPIIDTTTQKKGDVSLKISVNTKPLVLDVADTLKEITTTNQSVIMDNSVFRKNDFIELSVVVIVVLFIIYYFKSKIKK